MLTYSIVGVTVKDPQLFQKYVDGHMDSLTKFGGRFVVAGSDFELIEGVAPGDVIVVHEWPDRTAFHAWYASDDYRPWKEMRFASAVANVILIDGLPLETDNDASKSV